MDSGVVLLHLASGGDKNKGGDGGGEPGESLKNWSSIIGIVTAIVGNVLIALALNVQRYAHTQLNKEKARVRRQAQEALKRARNGNGNVNGNGSGLGNQDTTTYGGGGGYGSIEVNGSRPVNGSRANGHESPLSPREDEDSQETDPLTASLTSSDLESQEAEGKGDQDSGTSYLKSPYWWAGQILITLGETGNFLAYGFAPASIVSPLGVVALISNCIIAPAMFKEKFRPRDFWGVVIAVGGVVTVVLSAKQEETKLDPHAVWDAITSLAFEIYLAVTIGLIIILMWASSRYGRQTILIDLGLVGLFGGYTALSTKGVSSMLSSTLWRAFATPVTYALILVLLSTAIMQIRYVNKALQRFDSTQVIPVQFVMFTLCVILGSAVLYRDFEKTTAEQAGRFVGGCLLTFFGVFLITSGREQHEENEDFFEDANGVEETIGLRYQDSNTDEQRPSTASAQGRRSSKTSHVPFLSPVISGEATEDFERPVSTYSPATSPGQEPSSLHYNAWKAQVDAMSPTRRQRAISSDSVPQATGADSQTQYFPAVPPRDQTSPLTPTTSHEQAAPSSVAARPGLGTSRSTGQSTYRKTFISPSPLSSTVTTVVKDAFLRPQDNNDLTRTSSIRRIRSSIRASLFFDDEDATLLEQSIHGGNVAESAGGAGTAAASEADLTSTLRSQEAGLATPDDEADAFRRRSRSVSDTLGDFFRVRKKRRNEAAGPAEFSSNRR